MILMISAFVFSGCSQIEKLVTNANESKRDLTPPGRPTILFPSVSPYTHVGAADSIVIYGNVSFNTEKILGPNATEIIPQGVAWSYTHTLVPDTETELKFFAVDGDGNIAEPRVVVIRWYPSTYLPLAGGSPGGVAFDNETAFSAVLTAAPTTTKSIDATTAYQADFGLHRIVREMRVRP